MFKKLFSIVAFVALGIMGVQAQMNPMEPLPQDPELRKGVLENGLTYYIKHNAKPENQADFYIYDKVGAVQEEDHQIGLAHFLEHMAFNGTKNFPDKNMINYLESVGVKFGANLNAWTAMEQTQYMMQSVPLGDPTVVDNVLTILHDWAYYISLEEEEIDNERGVIIEELRTRNDASWRIREKSAPYIYGPTRYADRNIIGTIEQLQSFSYDDIRTFYHRWYNTKNQCIVIVGDFDVDEMEQKVIKTMSDIPAVENAEEIAYIPIPATVEPQIGIFTDPELTDTSIELIFRRDAMPKELNNTMVYELYNILDGFVGSIVNERFSDIAQQPNAPFMLAMCYGGSMTRSLDITELLASAREGEALKAFEALYTEYERVRRYGFTVSEFERAQAKILRSNQQAYDRRNDRRHGEFVRRYTENFSNGTPIYSAEFEWQLDSMLITSLDIATLNQFAQQMRFTPTNQVILISQPEKEGIAVPTVEEVQAVIAKVNAAEIEAPVDNTVKKPLIPEGTVLKGSKVKKSTTDKFGNTVWTLKNGVKVVLKPTDFKADEIQLHAGVVAGQSIISDEDMVMSDNISGFIAYQGVGEFSRTELTKQMAGKAISISPFVGGSMQGINAICSPKDLEEMFQLLYLYGTSPRFDEDAFNTVKDQLVNAYANIESTPNYALQRELYKSLYNNPNRAKAWTSEEIKSLNFEQYKRVYQALFSNPDDFTFTIVGNFSEEEIKPLVEKYIGSLPKTKGKLAYNYDNAVGYQNGDRTNRFEEVMEMPKTTIYYVLSGEMEVNLENYIYLSVLEQVLDIRYTKSIREEKGGTYGVSCSANLSSLPSLPDFALLIGFDTKPEMADELRDMLIPEIERIAADGATEEEIGKIKEYMVKKRADDLKQNGNWKNWIVNYHLTGVDYTTDYDAIVGSLSSEKVKAIAVKVLESGDVLKLIMDPKVESAQE